MYITNNTNLVKKLEDSGVDTIFIDLEIDGKLERQGHLDTHVTDHKKEDIIKIKKEINSAKLLVRVNPISERSKQEIDYVVNHGADIVMLPMFKTRQEVEQFIEYVDGRAKVCLLLETAQAMVRINDIIEVRGIDEIHIGLNDLHLSLGLDFMFELLSEGIVDYLSKIIKSKGIKFGFGGIARIGEGTIPAEMILGEHYRLNSSMVILSRSFRNNMNDLSYNIKSIRDYEKTLESQDHIFFKENQEKLKKKIRNYVINKRGNNEKRNL